jgi:hypothetical protein
MIDLSYNPEKYGTSRNGSYNPEKYATSQNGF